MDFDNRFAIGKIHHYMHDLKADSAVLVIDRENVHYQKLNRRKDIEEFQVWKEGELPTIFIVDRKDTCPVCEETLTKYEEEQYPEAITRDYKCTCCGFQGTQWITKAFCGHTSNNSSYTLESYKHQYAHGLL